MESTHDWRSLGIVELEHSHFLAVGQLDRTSAAAGGRRCGAEGSGSAWRSGSIARSKDLGHGCTRISQTVLSVSIRVHPWRKIKDGQNSTCYRRRQTYRPWDCLAAVPRRLPGGDPLQHLGEGSACYCPRVRRRAIISRRSREGG